MRNKRNKTWMAACTLVVIVAFGSACTTTQTHQITQESFRSLQKDTNPKPTHVIKTTGIKLRIESDFRDNLSIILKKQNPPHPLEIDSKFSMTDTEIEVVTDQYEAMTVPLDEISGYYITDKSLGLFGFIGIMAGVLTLGALALLVNETNNHDH